jgi:hypothetical protein
MRITNWVLILIASCLGSLCPSGTTTCTSLESAVPLCSVLSDPGSYDGKEITVRGLYRTVLHGSILMGSACLKTLVNVRGAPDYKANKHALAIIRSATRKDQFQPVNVVIRGTFRVAHEGQCFGQNCLSFEIEDHELLCAETQKPQGSSDGQPPESKLGH